MGIRPYGDRILIQRLNGHGVETVTRGGVVLPAVEWRRGTTHLVADTFRARAIAVGDRVREVREGDEIIVYTYGSNDHDRTLVGWDVPDGGTMIREHDVLGVVEAT